MADTLRVMMLMASRAAGHGGRETAIRRVACALAARGHDVSVALIGPSRDRAWEASLPGLQVGGLSPSWEGVNDGRLTAVRFVGKALHSHKPDVVLVTEPAGSLLVRVASVTLGVPRPTVASWLHGNVDYLHHAWALRYCDGHLAISAGIAAQVQRRVRSQPYIVYNPVETSVALCVRPAPGEPTAFLCLGRLDAGKRVDRLLRSLATVKKGAWFLQVVGDGTLRPGLERLAKDLGISERIAWRGWLADPWSMVGPVTALLLTSEHEGFPMVLIEAIAHGVPLIAMDCDFGPREVIHDGRNGWLVPAGDEVTMARILEDVCVSPSLLPNPASVRLTAHEFETAQVVERIETAILELVSRRSG